MQQDNLPLISIITSSLNDIKELIKTYQSILNLSYSNIEWIIIDGGSSDGTVDFLKKNVKFKWISEDDNGIYDAWNKGIKLSKGEWIIFLGAGDLLSQKWIEAALSILISKDVPQIIYGNQCYINRQGDIVGKRKGLSWAKTQNKLKYSMILPHAGMLHHRSIFKNFLFDDSYLIAGDWKFFLTANLKLGLYLNIDMAFVLTGGISMSNKSIRYQFYEYKKIVNLGIAKKNVVQNLKWNIKFLLSNNSKIYNFFQLIWMKI